MMRQSLICVVDILGTKGFWTNENSEKYFKVLNGISEILEDAKFQINSGKEKHFLEFDYLTFSDTLVITLTNDKNLDDERSNYFFHERIALFNHTILAIFQAYYAEGFLIRGAISFGDMDKRGNHFIGPAVDDVAEYLDLMDMIGICFTPKASYKLIDAIEWNRKFFNMKIDTCIVKYNTPLKNGKELELFQIDWVSHFIEREKSNTDGGLSELSSFFSNRNIPLSAVSKFTNAVKFFNFVKGQKI